MFVSNAALIKTATMKRDIRGNSLASGVSETMAKNCLNCTICFFYYYHTAPYHTATHTHIYVVNVLSSVRRKCNAVQCSADRTTWSICSARNWKQKKVKICYRIVYQSRNITIKLCTTAHSMHTQHEIHVAWIILMTCVSERLSSALSFHSIQFYQMNLEFMSPTSCWLSTTQKWRQIDVETTPWERFACVFYICFVLLDY